MDGAATRSGETVGRYHLHREIAKGGMARIHIARSIGSGGFSRLVAAKRLDPALANDTEFVEMFLDEARVASKVRHRNVVPVIDVVTIDGELILVQELVHGAPLHKVFERAQQANRRIPIDVAVSIATQILAGLQAAHDAVDETGTSLNIVHRDVSPQNVMIATDGMARLLDFGVAKTAAGVHVTHVGTFKGKLAYSSPEQLGGTSTRQTDIYALGVVLWELLVGKRMHAGCSDAELYGKVMKSTPPLLTEALATQRGWGMLDNDEWQQLEALEPIVARALARDLDTRYATAAEMERALAAVVQPAPLADVAAWLRSHVQDLLDQREQVIAAEEASWRAAKGSGCLPVSALTDNDSGRRRASTSLETEAARPHARARLWDAPVESAPQPTRWRRPRRWIALTLADALIVLTTIQLLFASAAQPQPRQVATAMLAVPQLFVVHAPPKVTAAVDTPKPVVQPSTTVQTTKKPAVKRRGNAQRPAKVTRASACASPYYYEGGKKIFKPACL